MVPTIYRLSVAESVERSNSAARRARGRDLHDPASISVSSSATTFTVNGDHHGPNRGSAPPTRVQADSLGMGGHVRWGWCFGRELSRRRDRRWSGRRYRRYLGLLPLTLLLFTISCGGGGIGVVIRAVRNQSNGTPAGTYTLTVTATSGSTTGTTPVTLTVK